MDVKSKILELDTEPFVNQCQKQRWPWYVVMMWAYGATTPRGVYNWNAIRISYLPPLIGRLGLSPFGSGLVINTQINIVGGILSGNGYDVFGHIDKYFFGKCSCLLVPHPASNLNNCLLWRTGTHYRIIIFAWHIDKTCRHYFLVHTGTGEHPDMRLCYSINLVWTVFMTKKHIRQFRICFIWDQC